MVYNIAGQASTFAADNNVVVLNEVHIDIMDYINPANCTNLEFRTMWSEFEWENKVAVNTQIKYVLYPPQPLSIMPLISLSFVGM